MSRNDTAEESLEKKVQKLERRSDYLHKRPDLSGYALGEANALDFAAEFITDNWEAAIQYLEKRRKERA